MIYGKQFLLKRERELERELESESKRVSGGGGGYREREREPDRQRGHCHYHGLKMTSFHHRVRLLHYLQWFQKAREPYTHNQAAN